MTRSSDYLNECVNEIMDSCSLLSSVLNQDEIEQFTATEKHKAVNAYNTAINNNEQENPVYEKMEMIEGSILATTLKNIEIELGRMLTPENECFVTGSQVVSVLVFMLTLVLSSQIEPTDIDGTGLTPHQNYKVICDATIKSLKNLLFNSVKVDEILKQKMDFSSKPTIN